MPETRGRLRKAGVADVESIYKLLTPQAAVGVVLPRTRMDLYSFLRDYFVWDEPGQGIIGVAGLHICWSDLAEVRSVVVEQSWRGAGRGRRLVAACLAEARELGIARAFVLTNREDFFGKQGFRRVDKSTLPQKIWIDCVNCFKFPDCDEVPMELCLDGRGGDGLA